MKFLPSLEEAIELKKLEEYKIVPISTEILSDIKTPIEVMRILKNVSSHCYMLESIEDNRNWGRYTFLGYEPKMEITCTNSRLVIKGEKKLEVLTSNPGQYIREILNDYKSKKYDYLQTFTGGLVGYFSYDYIKYAEHSLNLGSKDEEHFKDVDLIMFCTKNPIPILNEIEKIDKKILFHVTLTPYKKDIEPNILPKGKIIEAIKKLSSIIGIDNLQVRYDPIFISEKYNLEYHIKAFDNLCTLLKGYVNKIIVSFLDDYKNVRKNMKTINYKPLTEYDYEMIGKNFSKSAKKNGMIVQTCFEDRNLVEYGFTKGECISHELAYKLTGKTYKNWTARKEKNVIV